MASNPNYSDVTPAIEALARRSLENSSIAADDYVRYDVKRGLRDLNGKGVLAGEDMGDDAFDALIARIEDAYDDLEIDAHRGDQPLYPVVMSVE